MPPKKRLWVQKLPDFSHKVGLGWTQCPGSLLHAQIAASVKAFSAPFGESGCDAEARRAAPAGCLNEEET